MAIDARTAPEVPTQGEDDGGRDWVKILVLLGAVAFLAACGIYIAMNRPDTPKSDPTPTAVVDSQQAAYDASTKVVSEYLSWSAANPGKVTPEQFATSAFIQQDQAFVDQLTKGGRHVEGADKVLWVKPVDYSVGRVTVKTCSEVHGKILDQAGNNVRVNPDGQQIAEGSQTGTTYFLVPGSGSGTWLVNEASVTSTC